MLWSVLALGSITRSLSRLISSARTWIQASAVFLSNLFLLNLPEGRIYQGNLKKFCVPGLNCYSCPAASGACPVGALQAVSGSSKFTISFYVTGFLMICSESCLVVSYVDSSVPSDGFRNCCIKYHPGNFPQKK